MPLVTTTFERALHLGLFLSAGIAGAVVALAGLERVTEGPRRIIRVPHIAVVVSVFVALFIVERIYHAVH